MYVPEEKSWYSALEHCRKQRGDLPAIEDEQQQKRLLSVLPANSKAPVWLGLFRVPWEWSDGSRSAFRTFSSSGTSTYQEEKFCVSAKSGWGWSDFGCSSQLPFICQQGEAGSRWTWCRFGCSGPAG